MQRLRAADRDRDDARDRDEFFIRKIDKTEGVVREVREIERSARTNTSAGIREYITNLGKELKRDQDEAVKDGSAFTSDKAEICRLASDIDGVRERSKETRLITRKPSIERGIWTRGTRNILIKGWRILGYGEKRG